METSGACPSCNQPLPADIPLGGLCPQCLLRSGFYSGTAPEPEKRTIFAAPSALELASLFPQLEIAELIGRGGMGAVYKARQPKLNRLVALKILARGGDNDARFAERFQREAQALAQMNHPNIVTVYDFGEAGGHYFLLMEFVDGLNLRQIEKGQKLTPEAALAIVPPICDALQYAHSQGIVHRDIKPENILLDKGGRVKIADFGIAKIVGGAPAEPLTGDDQRVGTPHYMAPEQVEKPTTVDHRADIYSLGVVFYEMLTGELPLGRFAAPSKKVQIDVRLDEIVMRALEKEPELRYQQVSEIRTQVETLTIPAVPSTDASHAAGRTASSALNNSNEAQALTMGAITMLLMLALGHRIVSGPNLVFWYIGFGIGLVSILIQIHRARVTSRATAAPPKTAADKYTKSDQPSLAKKCWPKFLLALFYFVGGICSLATAVLWYERYPGDEAVIGLWICNGAGLLILSIYKGIKAFSSSRGHQDNAVSPTASGSGKEPISKKPLKNFLLYFSFFFGLLAVYFIAGDAFDQFGFVFFFVILMMSIAWGIKLLREPGKTTEADKAEDSEKGVYGMPAPAASIADAKKQLRMPGIVLQIAGYLNMLLFIWICMPAITLGYSGMLGSVAIGLTTFIALGALYLALAISGMFIIRGGRLMMQLRNREMAMTGAILAIITPPGMVLGLPFGIWALIALNQPEIRKAFDQPNDRLEEG